MTDPAIIAATFSDWRPVKSRKVLQLIFEVPVEETEKVLTALGAPMPHEEHWCSIALLREEPKPDKPKKRFDEMSRAQQAGVLCNDENFQKWAWKRFGLAGTHQTISGPEAVVAGNVKMHCRVTSRVELDQDVDAAWNWDALVTEYRQATGQIAEQRS